MSKIRTFGWSSRTTESLKSELFGNVTTLETAEIWTFGFQTMLSSLHYLMSMESNIGPQTWLHIILVRCSRSFSKVRNFSPLTAIIAPLKNLSELMKNRTFFARFSAEMWMSDVLWCVCDDDAMLNVDWGLVVPFFESPFGVISSLCWVSLMQTFRNCTVTSFLLLMLLVAVLMRLERGLGTLFKLEQDERPRTKENYKIKNI